MSENCDCDLLEKLAENVAEAIFPHYMDGSQREPVKNALIAFASEIVRLSIEP